jgi:hypothetical protein
VKRIFVLSAVSRSTNLGSVQTSSMNQQGASFTYPVCSARYIIAANRELKCHSRFEQFWGGNTLKQLAGFRSSWVENPVSREGGREIGV